MRACREVYPRASSGVPHSSSGRRAGEYIRHIRHLYKWHIPLAAEWATRWAGRWRGCWLPDERRDVPCKTSSRNGKAIGEAWHWLDASSYYPASDARLRYSLHATWTSLNQRRSARLAPRACPPPPGSLASLVVPCRARNSAAQPTGPAMAEPLACPNRTQTADAAPPRWPGGHPARLDKAPARSRWEPVQAETLSREALHVGTGGVEFASSDPVVPTAGLAHALAAPACWRRRMRTYVAPSAGASGKASGPHHPNIPTGVPVSCEGLEGDQVGLGPPGGDRLVSIELIPRGGVSMAWDS
eukprot:scaffold965_cov120-Isochrysis_galbana.AAC.11